MTVTNETVTENIEDIEDNISNEVIEDNKLAELKARMAEKKKQKVQMPTRIVEKPKRSIRLGVVGSGHAGSRISESFYKLGYPAVAFNTAMQDLEHIDLPEANKYLLEYGIGGAAKDLDIGHAAADQHREGIANILQDTLGDSEMLVLCFSLGGGSGAGSHNVMIDILSATGLPIIVITVLPMSTEDVQTKSNALHTLSKLGELAQNRVINNLIVIDNTKLEAIYSDVSHMNFFKVGNEAIVKPIDAFNQYSAMSSTGDKGIDNMELAKLLSDGEGLCIYGETHVTDYDSDPLAIAQAVVENHDNGLLASGFNLEQTKYVGIVIAANSKVWDTIPRGSVEAAREMIKENCPGVEDSFHGTYVDDTIKEDVVKIYSMFVGLGLPDERVTQLRKDVAVEQAKTQERAKSRNVNLTLDTGKEKTVSKAEEIRQKIRKNQSKFSQNFGQGKKIDFRKK